MNATLIGLLATALFAVIALLGTALFQLRGEIGQLGRELRGAIRDVDAKVDRLGERMDALAAEVAELRGVVETHLPQYA
jgi:outer membrane murein-binding lipoprotein Lpp